MTRQGKKGFLGIISHGVKSINRFYINNFEDDDKHSSITMFLGRHPRSKPTGLRAQVNKELKKFEHLFTRETNINLFIGSWNMGGKKPNETIDIDSWLLQKDKPTP